MRFKSRIEHGQPFCAGIGSRLLIGVDDNRLTVLALGAHRDNFIAKTPGINRGTRFLLRAQRVSILQLTAYTVLTRQVFRRHAHMIIIKRVPQPVMHQAVEQLAVTQLRAGAAVGEDMRSAAHVLLPTGNDHIRFTTLDGLRGKMQRL